MHRQISKFEGEEGLKNFAVGAVWQCEKMPLLKPYVVAFCFVELRNWSAIAKLMPGRTDNRCRRRWFVLMKNDPKVRCMFFRFHTF